MNFLETIVEFFIFYVILRGVIAYWLADKVRKMVYGLGERLGKAIKAHLIKTERDLTIWMHHQNRLLNKGHKDPVKKCMDGTCKTL